MTDDYYEEKALAEITEKGFKAGEFVGDLPDPTTHNEAALGGAGLGGGGGSKADRGAGGIYRAGGPTTIFGSSGWGPFSDGPLNAVRKSLLSRDNVTEENWMLMMAARVREADEEWAKWRQEARKVPEGVQGVYMGDAVLANGLPARVNASKSKSVQRAVQEEEGVVVDDGGYQEGYPKRKKVVGFETETEASSSSAPLGVYDPHSNLIFCELTSTSHTHQLTCSQTVTTLNPRPHVGSQCLTILPTHSRDPLLGVRRWETEPGALPGSIPSWSSRSPTQRKAKMSGYLLEERRPQLRLLGLRNLVVCMLLLHTHFQLVGRECLKNADAGPEFHDAERQGGIKCTK